METIFGELLKTVFLLFKGLRCRLDEMKDYINHTIRRTFQKYKLKNETRRAVVLRCFASMEKKED